MLAAGKVKEVSVRAREMTGQQQQHPLANPLAGEKQTGFAIAKGWWKEEGRQLGAEEKQAATGG